MSISDIYSLLISTYVDWSHVLVNPQYIRQNLRDGSCITWNKRIPRMLDNPVMASDVVELFDTGQYTFQIEHDGSLIQIYYKYDIKNILTSARLAFYNASTNEQKSVQEELFTEYSATEMMTSEDASDGQLMEKSDSMDLNKNGYETEINTLRNGPVSWLRIDYDPINTKGVLHHDCHIHFSAFPYSRIVVAGVPTPAQFIEFIMAFCYPEFYKAHRLNENGQYTSREKIITINASCFPLVEDIAFRQIAHFRVPATH